MSEQPIGVRYAHCLQEVEAGIWLIKADCIENNKIPVSLALLENLRSVLSNLWIERTKFPVSSTLDRLLDSLDEPIPCPGCGTKGVIICEDGAWNCSDCNGDGAVGITPEAEADLGTIEHKGEKVTVKIKVVRGESQ